MSMTCSKCNKEIKPGENVSLLGVDELLKDGRRIFAGDETLVMHEVCPSSAGDTDDIDRKVLVACWARKAQLEHVPREDWKTGLSCDEMGCGICNAGDEFVEWAVHAFFDNDRDLLGHLRPTDADLVDAAAEYVELARERL